LGDLWPHYVSTHADLANYHSSRYDRIGCICEDGTTKCQSPSIQHNPYRSAWLTR
jgi:hypothetical protein